MTQPLVVCVMLTRDRPEMARRAIASFQSQNYERKRLYVLDSGKGMGAISALPDRHPELGIVYHRTQAECKYTGRLRTIGDLRNYANEWVFRDGADLIAHWDDDDWSYPRRLEEQVALLQASGKQCVGYRELLFWDTRCEACDPIDTMTGAIIHMQNCPPGEAWLYRNDDPRWVAGTSMLYTREAWEACPFDDAPHEDQRWWLKNAEKCLGQSSIDSEYLYDGATHPRGGQHAPRMIAQIHTGGTEQIPREMMHSGGGGVWRRAPEYDGLCERTMKL